MGTVSVDLSISLDGFIAGAGDGPAAPLGRGGDGLFTWMNAGPPENRVQHRLNPPERSKQVVHEWLTEGGAIISGRRTFDIAGGWADGHPIDVPIFVLTHRPPTTGSWSPRVEFVTEGIERALELAQAAAGEKYVSTCGAAPMQQLIRLRRLEEIQLSVAPLLLGGGVRLFEHLGDEPIQLEQLRAIESDGVTHLRYRVCY